MKPILEVQNISKKFRIHHERQAYYNLRDSLTNVWKSRGGDEEFFALNNVSFTVNAGESIGIIGKNGAGKSTLLKILSKITPPTTGKIVCRGRMASLLEVGTGFHPELSGRENVFLNGSILGMKRTEIQRNFDAIVDFAGVEKFLDTPLKHYSSGMQLRLAFAVAAFLENEIMIIDEVLAVGDAEFQKKCLGKMQEVTHSGRTVLFVSHNMTAVTSLCTRGIWLANGQVKQEGEISHLTDNYLKSSSENYSDLEEVNKKGDGVVKINFINLVNESGDKINYADIDKPIGIEINYSVLKDGYAPVPNIHFTMASGEAAFVSVEPSQPRSGKGTYQTTMWIPANFLNEGTYIIGFAISTLNPVAVHCSHYEFMTLEVVDKLDAATRNGYTGKIKGALRPLLKWESNHI